MAQTYLHVGVTRPATTALQSWLAQNEPALRPLSTFAPPQRLAHRLAVEGIASSERRAEPDIVGIMKSPLEQARNMLRQAAKSGISRIVISSEYFSLCDPASVRELLSDLTVDQVKIVLVFRRQDRLVEATYEQGVKIMGRKDHIRKQRYNRTMNWFELSSSWAQAFSPENLQIHCFDETAAGRGLIVSKIFEAMDDNLAALAAKNAGQQSPAPANLPADLLEFKRLANRAGAPDVLPLLERAAAQGFGSGPFRLDRAVAKAVLELYRDSNRKVAREFLGRKADLFDQRDLERDTPGADYTGKLPVETIAGLFALYMQEQAERLKGQSEAARAKRDANAERAKKAQTASVETPEAQAAPASTDRRVGTDAGSG